MPVFSAMGRILLMKAYGSLNSSQLGSKTGHSGGGLNSSGRGWLIVSDRPAGNSHRTSHRFVNKSRRATVAVECCFKSRLLAVGLGGSQSSSTREEAAYTHTNIHSLTHTSMHSEENVPRHWARPLKKLDTTTLLSMRARFMRFRDVWRLWRLIR